jgi:hypothetical protein
MMIMILLSISVLTHISTKQQACLTDTSLSVSFSLYFLVVANYHGQLVTH